MHGAKIILPLALLACLSGCDGMASNTAADARQHGRYAGIGIYAPGKLWGAQVNAEGQAKQDPARAKLIDDDAIIVVVDGKTGEVRECGNYSGYCAAIQPWTKAVETGPVKLSKHASDVADDSVAPSSANAADVMDGNGSKNAQHIDYSKFKVTEVPDAPATKR